MANRMPSNFVTRTAESYDASMGRWSRQLAAPFLDFAGVPSRGRVLDAGCGTGSLTLALANHPDLTTVDALDFESRFLSALRLRTNDPRVRTVQGDACALPYGTRTFDGAYSLLVLHFVSDGHKAVREMRRVLRPGASAAATVWAHGGLPSWSLFWDTAVALEPDAARGRATKRPLTGEGELRAAFEGAGFTAVADRMLQIGMDYADFDDFWYPMAYGQGSFGTYFDALPEPRRERLRDGIKAAYLAGGSDGPRSFPSQAWAVRGAA